MFFGANLKQRIIEMEAEINKLKENNRHILEENESLKLRCFEQENKGSTAETQKEAVCSTWMKGGELVINVRETVLNVACSLESEQQQLLSSMSIYEQTRQSVDEIRGQVDTIQAKAQESSEQVKSLLEVSEQIEKFVSVIRDISDQTNLLALNAAIEAARAGDSGRGFAVVADEVRNLARKANEASGEIAGLVGEISSQTMIASEDINKVDELSNEVVVRAEHIGKGVNEVVELANHMQTVINNSATSTFIETVKLDHVNWKNQVYEAIVSENNIEPSSMADHTSCRLGKWYDSGDGKQKFSNLASYGALNKPHETVHREGRAAIAAYNANDRVALLSHLRNMEQASVEVATVLDRINIDAKDK